MGFSIGCFKAYATVQNPDGSIHYLTYSGTTTPWATSAWQGSDNNTVYNGVDFGLVAPGGGTALANTTALSSLFAAMVAPAGLPGGTAWIPQYNYPVNASLVGLTVPIQSIFQGLGTGGHGRAGTNVHFLINDTTSAGTFLSCSGVHTSGGTFFKNLAFQWSDPEFAGDTVLFLQYQGNAVEDCTFLDCPTALYIRGLTTLVKHCEIYYNVLASDPPTNVTAILLHAVNCEISGPSEFNGGPVVTASPGTSTCISIGGGATGCNLNTLRNLHMYYWNYGIDYSDINDTGVGSGTADNIIDRCYINIIRTAIYLTPSDSVGKIFNQTFTNNVLTKDHDSNEGGPIVFIDSNGGPAENIGPISFVNNVIYSNVSNEHGHQHGEAQHDQYGVKIGTCSEVSIIGGQISQCGTLTATGADGTANVCISGNPSLVILDSVNLNSTYPGVNSGKGTGTTGSGPSQYALLITGDPSYVQVNNCNMSGFSGAGQAPVSVTGSPTTLIITNSPGYNDQNTPINTLAHILPGTAYSAATQGAHGGTSYYGPSFIMFTSSPSSGGTVAINGGTPQMLLPSQVVCLTLASPYDTIEFNLGHGPTAFTWIGK